MLDMLGYDADSYPPDYYSMTYKAESLLRQAAPRDHNTWLADSNAGSFLTVRVINTRISGYNAKKSETVCSYEV